MVNGWSVPGLDGHEWGQTDKRQVKLIGVMGETNKGNKDLGEPRLSWEQKAELRHRV